MSKKLPELKYEIAAALIFLVIAIFLVTKNGLEESSIWLASIVLGVAPVTLALIKIYLYQQRQDLNKTVDELILRFTDGPKLANSIIHKMAVMPASNVRYAQEVLKKAEHEIDNIEHGIIKLSESEYYVSLMHECRNHKKGCGMLSVNAFEERRFFADPRQVDYFEENKRAIDEREATIERIFIFNDREESSEVRNQNIKAIKTNYEAGISVSVVKMSGLAGLEELIEDWVMFSNPETHSEIQLLVDYQDKKDKTRVGSGELRISGSDIAKFRTNFEKLKDLAIGDGALTTLFQSIAQE
jgi:hypothetical protein